MRTSAEFSDGEVTVMAEDAITEREPLINKPKVEIASTLFLYLATMGRATAVDMVYGEKLQLRFPTTKTLSAVVLNNLNLQALISGVSIFTNNLRILCSISLIRCSLLLLVRFIILARIHTFRFRSLKYSLLASHVGYLQLMD